MTAQLSDLFVYRECEFDLADISGGQDLDISFLGLEPKMTSTGCWNGYQAVFGISQYRLVLHSFFANLMQEGQTSPGRRLEGPTINGVAPLSMRRSEPPSIYYQEEFNNYYYGIDLPLEFTGGMLIGDGFIEEGWGYSGFASAWHYETVFELIFETGKLVAEIDCSQSMATIRDDILGNRQHLAWSERQEVIQELAGRFLNREYRFKG